MNTLRFGRVSGNIGPNFKDVNVNFDTETYTHPMGYELRYTCTKHTLKMCSEPQFLSKTRVKHIHQWMSV